LNFNQPGRPPDEPNGDIFGWPLLEVAKLRRENGDWLLNDERLVLKEWMRLELQKLYGKRGIPAQYRTPSAQFKAYWRAKQDELPSQYVTREILDSSAARSTTPKNSPCAGRPASSARSKKRGQTVGHGIHRAVDSRTNGQSMTNLNGVESAWNTLATL
jgi:hypothetical protein